MRIQLVRIGNSQGIRLPKSIIEQAQLAGELDLEVREGEIIIRRVPSVRANWEDDARACREDSSDDLQDWDATLGDFSGQWNVEEQTE